MGAEVDMMDNRILRQYVDRGISALEGIRDALETANASDPLSMLNQALADGMAPDTMPGANAFAGTTTDQAGKNASEVADILAGYDPGAAEVAPRKAPHPDPVASNGITYLYRHPNPDYVIVLSKDKTAPSGWVASIQEA